LFRFLVFFALLLFAEFFHLTCDFLFQSCLFQVFYLLLEVGQFLTCRAGTFLFSLRFLDGTNGIFNFGIRFLQQPFCLFFSFLQDFLAAAFQLLYFLLVTGDGIFHLFFPLTYVLTLGFPVTLVAYNILQVFVALDVFTSHNFRCVCNDFFRQTDFTGNLYGKRTSRIANLQLEQRPHLVAVVQHGSVHHSFVIFGKMLQILVVSGNHAERTFQVEAFQYGFGNGTANLWLRTSSELIDKDEAFAVA